MTNKKIVLQNKTNLCVILTNSTPLIALLYRVEMVEQGRWQVD
jgi:hypothetical protein